MARQMCILNKQRAYVTLIVSNGALFGYVTFVAMALN